MIDLKELLKDVFEEMNKKSVIEKTRVIKDLKARGKLSPDETSDVQFLTSKDFFELD